MNKFNSIIFRFIFVLVCFILLFFPQSTTRANFVKYNNNPIISSLKYSAWYGSHTLNPYITLENSNYNLLFTANSATSGRWNIGKASSSNGIDAWNISPDPIFEPSGSWEFDINFANILTDNQQFKLWYNTGTTTWLSGPDRFRIGYAISPLNYIWSRYPHVLFGGPNTWDMGGPDRGFSIVYKDSLYHLWYAATNAGNLADNPYWRIGYATSSDGINWTKHSNNPVIEKTTDWELNNMMYPYVLYEDEKFKMWYGTGSGDMCVCYVYAESTNGYEWTKPQDKNPVYCKGNSGFDQVALSGHSRIRDGDIYKIWYSGFDGGRWSIGYATESAVPVTVTPTPTPIEPIVIVPGMMASWNKEGILEGQPNPTTPWKLLPFVKEYEGLIQTLKNLGYQEGQTLFIWPYDWRKSVDSITTQLNQFIDTAVKPQNPGSKIQLVGHSLGGLVVRTWSQNGTNKENVHNLITVASPHKGTIQPYKPWSGGDVTQDNSFLSLASRIIIELNRRAFSTPREAIQSQLPVLKDILPTENYLQNSSDGMFINVSDMNVKNTWLTGLNTTASSIFPMLTAIKGIGLQTPNTYTVNPPTWLDKALGNWLDGKPVDQELADGDSIITGSRASLDDPSLTVTQNHGNAIASSEGVKKILDTLEIPYTESSVIPGQATTINPGLLFLLRSPATLSVLYNGQTYHDFDGIVFIPNADTGAYQATVVGTGTGSYRLAIGQLGETSAPWKEYNGSTTDGQQTLYVFPFSQTSPIEDPAANLTDKERLDDIDIQLTALSQLSSHTSIAKAKKDLKLAMTALTRKDFYTLKRQLEFVLQDLSALRKSPPPEAARLKSFAISDSLIDTFQAIFSKKPSAINTTDISKLQTICNNENNRLNTLLENKYNQGTITNLQTSTFKEAITYKAKANTMTPPDRAKKYILLFQTQLLFREI